MEGGRHGGRGGGEGGGEEGTILTIRQNSTKFSKIQPGGVWCWGGTQKIYQNQLFFINFAMVIKNNNKTFWFSIILLQAWHEHLRNVCVSQIGCSTVGRVYLFMCLRVEFSANDRVRHFQLPSNRTRMRAGQG